MANIKFSQFTADGNIDGNSVTAKTGSETSFLVGYDSTGSTNNMWTFPQVAEGLNATNSLQNIYNVDGTLAGARTITMDGNRLNLNQSTTGDYIKMDAPTANASPTFIDGRRNGATRAKLSLNSGSGRLELFHFGSTKYVDLNPGGVINYFLTDTAIGNTTASAKLHVKGASGADSLLVENNAGTDILTITDAGVVKITGQAYTEIETSVAINNINWNNSNVQEVTLVSGATTDFDATNFKAGATYILKLIQPAGGNALVGWEAAGAVVNWSGGTPPTLSTAAAAEDIVTLICTSAAGNGTYYANATLNFS